MFFNGHDRFFNVFRYLIQESIIMKMISSTKLFILLAIINLSYGEFDGMASCAWGRHNKVSKRNIFGSSLRSVKEDDIKFLLYNKDYPHPYQIYINDESRLASGNFDIKKQTKIVIHGYRSSFKSSSCVLIRDAFLNNGDFNIIIVDWNRAQYWGINHAFPLVYPQVVDRLGAVAEYVRQMISFLEKYGMNLKTTTLIGHSLGAHVAGIAGRNLKTKINRLVGLDPAGPYFSEKSPEERLSKDAATQVEVIHTEIEQCGLNIQLGHYDFYPNSGEKQPGCDKNKCSHSRSYRFFAESIGTKVGFHARKCSDWQSMQKGTCNGKIALMGGLERGPTEEGIYYVKTNDKSPFAMGPP